MALCMANSVDLWHLILVYTVCKGLSVPINRVYSFSYFKYGIYKPREVKKSEKETSAKHEFLYQIFFYLPRFISPIFKIGEMNKLYITCI